MEMTHKRLVEKARGWLLHGERCNPVFAERGSAVTSEMPDAIGWTCRDSIVVECKISRNDFLKDLNKLFRKMPRKGMGKYRYYFFSEAAWGTIAKEEIPKGWGYSVRDEATGQTIAHRESKVFAFDPMAELYYLRSRVLEIQKFGK